MPLLVPRWGAAGALARTSGGGRRRRRWGGALPTFCRVVEAWKSSISGIPPALIFLTMIRQFSANFSSASIRRSYAFFFT